MCVGVGGKFKVSTLALTNSLGEKEEASRRRTFGGRKNADGYPGGGRGSFVQYNSFCCGNMYIRQIYHLYGIYIHNEKALPSSTTSSGFAAV